MISKKQELVSGELHHSFQQGIAYALVNKSLQIITGNIYFHKLISKKITHTSNISLIKLIPTIAKFEKEIQRWLSQPDAPLFLSNIHFHVSENCDHIFNIQLELMPESSNRILCLFVDTINDTSQEEHTQPVDKTGYQNTLPTLHEVKLAMSSFQETKALIQFIVEKGANLVKADSCAILLPDTTTGDLVFQTAFDSTVGTHILQEAGSTPNTISLEIIQIANNIHKEPRHYDMGSHKINTPAHSMLVIPMYVANEFIGVLTAYNKYDKGFGTQDTDILISMANYSAPLIKSIQSHEASQNRLKELTLLVNASTAVSTSLDLETALPTLAHQISKVMQINNIAISLWNQEADTVVTLLDYSTRPDRDLDHPGTVYPLSEYPNTKNVLLKRAPLYINFGNPDISQTEIDLLQQWEYHALFMIPLIVRDQVIGLLELYSEQERLYMANELTLCQTLANHLAATVENAQLFKQVQQQTRELEQKVAQRTAELEKFYRRQSALTDIEVNINQSYTLQPILNRIIDIATHLLPASKGASVLLWDNETQKFSQSATNIPNISSHTLLQKTRISHGVSQWVINNRKAIIVEDTDHSPIPNNLLLNELDIRAYMSVPLVADEQSLGVLFANDAKPRTYNPDDIEFLTSLASRAAAAIMKTRLYEAEREQRARAETHAIELHVRARHLQLLNSIAHTAIEHPNLQTMVKTMAHQLSNLFNADGCSIAVWTPQQKLLKPITLHYDAHREKHHKHITIEAMYAIIELMMENHNVLIAADVSENPLINTHITPQLLVRALLGLPLIADEQMLGVILITFQQPHQFTSQEITWGKQAAQQLALAIAKIQAFETAQRRAEEAETLRQAGAIVVATLQQDQAIERILNQLERVVPYDSASVQLLRDGFLEIVGGHGWPNPSDVIGFQFPVPGNNPNTQVLEQRQPFILNNAPEAFNTFNVGIHSYVRSWLGVPLIVRDQMIGMLSLDSIQNDYFTEHHAQLVSAFADQVAVAIENARLFETTKRNAAELKSSRDIFHQLNAYQDVFDAFPNISLALQTLTGCHRASLTLFDDKRGKLTIIANHQSIPGLDTNANLQMQDLSAANHILADKPHFSPNLANEVDFTVERILYEHGYRSRLNLPLRTPQGITGALSLGWLDINGYDLTQLPVLKQVAAGIALAIQKYKLLEAERRRVDEMRALRAIIVDVSAGRNFVELHEMILKRAVFMLEATGGQLGLYHEHTHQISIVTYDNLGEDYLGKKVEINQSTVMGFVAETNEPLLAYPDARWHHDPLIQDSKGPWHSILAAPITLQGRLLGVIVLVNNQKNSSFSSSALELLILLAYHVAIVLDNAKLFNTVQQMATIDDLTGLHNRRRLFELGKKEFRRARRYNKPLSAIMLDIDHFKHVNDDYGHAVGDQVLYELAQNCVNKVREVDIFGRYGLGRYGGEEFTLLLPETSLVKAYDVAERLRSYIEQSPIHTERGKIFVTISLGVAELTQDTASLEALLDKADSALYKAKQSGRNQVQ